MSATLTGSPSPVREPGAPSPGSRALVWVLSKLKSIDVFGLVGVLIIYLAWWGVTTARLVEPVFLPHPQDVMDFWKMHFLESKLIAAQSLGDNGISGSVIYSSVGVWLAVVIAVVIGLPLGLMSARSVRLRMFSDPLLLTISGIPILIMAPFFMIWFGPARTTQMLLLTIFCVPVIYIYAQRAVNNLGLVYEQNAKLFGASNDRIVRDVYLRGTLPEVMGGMRIALAGSWGLGAITELMGAPKGIGKMIISFASNTNVVAIWAVVLSFAAVAVLTDLLLVIAMKWLNRWMA